MPTPNELAELFLNGEYIIDIDGSVWRDTFLLLAKRGEPALSVKHKAHMLWTVNGGHLRRKIQDDRLVLCVLKKYLPGYRGSGLWLYRGECQFLHEKNLIGFCWSPKIEVAERFASGLNAIESGGVLLKAYAPPEAILAEPNQHSAVQMEEFEFTCDPWLLKEIEIVKSFPAS